MVENPSRLLKPLPVHLAAALSANVPPAALAAMVAGIGKYQRHDFVRKLPPLEEAWRAGEASLRFCPAGKKRQGAVFIVPSMINRSAILDLLPDQSFVRGLAAAGQDVYLLDWGEPARDPGLADLSRVIEERLLPALAFAARAGPIAAIGYCMGGTLLAAAACLSPEMLRGAVFLAAPWDFHAGDRALESEIRRAAPAALQMIAARGSLPAGWIQSVFAAVNADRTAAKFASFSAEMDVEREALFVAVEDWLNDGVDLPGALAEECLTGWYGRNNPGTGTWRIGGQAIDPASLRLPALVVSSTTDRLVPYESAVALADIIPASTRLKPAIGHIGMMTGRRAESEIWRPVLAWLQTLRCCKL